MQVNLKKIIKEEVENVVGNKIKEIAKRIHDDLEKQGFSEQQINFIAGEIPSNSSDNFYPIDRKI